MLAAALVCAIMAAGPHATYRHNGDALLPDPLVTPGAFTNTTASQLCDPKFHTGSVRDVTPAERRAVYAEYGQVDHKGVCRNSKGKRDGCEVDHLISLELGGSNDLKNLWPQPYADDPGAHQKDALEDRLAAMVCHGDITLRAAQEEISRDWYAAYRRYVAK